MRILFYGYEYPPLGGGAGRAIKNLFEYFSKEKDITIDFITTSLNNKWEVEKKYKNITFYKIPVGSKKNKNNYHKQSPKDMVLYSINAFLLTWKLILKNKYNFSHFFGFPGGLVSFLFRWRMPYIISLRGVDVPGYNDRFKKYYIFYKPLSKIIWHYAKYVTANSKGLSDLAHKTYPNLDIKIIPNGIDTKKWRAVPEDNKYKIFSITAGGTLINKKKGHEYLVNAFALLHKKYKDTRLVLMGDGKCKKEIESLVDKLGISDVVEFTGFMQNEEIAEILPKFHVFCLPSLSESMSNASLEALACGLPLIITKHGASDLILKENGYIVPFRDYNQIYEKMRILYKNKELRGKLGLKSRRIAEGLGWRTIMKKYLELYRDIK